jgi:hypothetical protein
LNWLSAPAFFLILGILAINSKKQKAHNRQLDKIKVEISAVSLPKLS